MSPDNPNNPIDIQNIEASEAMQNLKDLGNKQEIDISEMILKLNADQRKVFDIVTSILKLGKSLLQLYISGEKGTGKSFLIKTIKC